MKRKTLLSLPCNLLDDIIGELSDPEELPVFTNFTGSSSLLWSLGCGNEVWQGARQEHFAYWEMVKPKCDLTPQPERNHMLIYKSWLEHYGSSIDFSTLLKSHGCKTTCFSQYGQIVLDYEGRRFALGSMETKSIKTKEGFTYVAHDYNSRHNFAWTTREDDGTTFFMIMTPNGKEFRLLQKMKNANEVFTHTYQQVCINFFSQTEMQPVFSSRPIEEGKEELTRFVVDDQVTAVADFHLRRKLVLFDMGSDDYLVYNEQKGRFCRERLLIPSVRHAFRNTKGSGFSYLRNTQMAHAYTLEPQLRAYLERKSGVLKSFLVWCNEQNDSEPDCEPLQGIHFTLVHGNDFFYFNESLDRIQPGSKEFKELVCFLTQLSFCTIRTPGESERHLFVASALVIKIIETSSLMSERLHVNVIPLFRNTTCEFEHVLEKIDGFDSAITEMVLLEVGFNEREGGLVPREHDMADYYTT